MTDTIETAVKTDVYTEVANLKSRMRALESEAAGYVKAHVLYFAVAIALVAGGVAGYLIHK